MFQSSGVQGAVGAARNCPRTGCTESWVPEEGAARARGRSLGTSGPGLPKRDRLPGSGGRGSRWPRPWVVGRQALRHPGSDGGALGLQPDLDA